MRQKPKGRHKMTKKMCKQTKISTKTHKQTKCIFKDHKDAFVDKNEAYEE